MQTSYLEQHPAVGVHVGPGVLGLALLQQHVGHDLVELSHQLEHGIVGKVLQCKLALAGVTRVGLPQDGVAVTWHHLVVKHHVRLRSQALVVLVNVKRIKTGQSFHKNLQALSASRQQKPSCV